ncbi:MAG: DUF3124 domain-containing protein [Deltaproteobacteria bacterium]|nr:DUF3124 domain-containing protein [Deltaproteobacteria bacterium]
MVNEPVIEAVMVGIQGQTSISFFITACAVLKPRSYCDCRG